MKNEGKTPSWINHTPTLTELKTEGEQQQQLPAALETTALEIQDCSPLQAWQQALWGHNTSPSTSNPELRCFLLI